MAGAGGLGRGADASRSPGLGGSAQALRRALAAQPSARWELPVCVLVFPGERRAHALAVPDEALWLAPHPSGFGASLFDGSEEAREVRVADIVDYLTSELAVEDYAAHMAGVAVAVSPGDTGASAVAEVVAASPTGGQLVPEVARRRQQGCLSWLWRSLFARARRRGRFRGRRAGHHPC